jgi:hypothetical protein
VRAIGRTVRNGRRARPHVSARSREVRREALREAQLVQPGHTEPAIVACPQGAGPSRSSCNE